MNSGKSMLLLAKAYNFDERGIPYCIYKSMVDTRDIGVIHSRPVGDKPCRVIHPDENFLDKEDWFNSDYKWLLVDEAQFLTKAQVDQLSEIVDYAGINVICYGLRTDFQTHLFEGSKRLFEIADSFEEIKSQCDCSGKNMFNARIDKNGKVVTTGEQIEVGAEDRYKSMCRKCYKDSLGSRVTEIFEIGNLWAGFDNFIKSVTVGGFPPVMGNNTIDLTPYQKPIKENKGK